MNTDTPLTEEQKVKMLYIGNLSPYVTEQALREIFQSVGSLREVKIIRDKKTGQGNGYGFVVFEEDEAAERAVQTLDGRLLFNQAMRVNWAYQSQNREELKNHFQIFVGDLGNTVTDSMLMQSFTQVGLTPSDARVMWDNATGRSRGYGFVSFKTHEEATKAIDAMNGQFIGSRRVRCGWAQHKQEPTQPSVDSVHTQDPHNVNVYVGNISADVSDTELKRQFTKFGSIVEVKIQRKGGYGFVRFARHEDACRAINGMNGQALGGRTLKCSWGKASQAQGPPAMMPPVPGMPLGAPVFLPGQGAVYMPPQMGQAPLMGPAMAGMIPSQGLMRPGAPHQGPKGGAGPSAQGEQGDSRGQQKGGPQGAPGGMFYAFQQTNYVPVQQQQQGQHPGGPDPRQQQGAPGQQAAGAQ